MRKLFILSLLAMMIAWGIGGCGGGSGGTSADPLGTDSIMLGVYDQDGNLILAPQVNPNGSLALKATVKNAAGTAVVGREVTFKIVSNASGATLISSSANTDGAGEATILYRAGATAGSDVVRASISNGARMDVNITVGGGTGSYQITLAADNTSLAAGQTAILTATVTNGSNDPVVGVVVTFAIPVNNSGAQTPTPVNGGLTDAGGKAVAYYTAGSNNSLMEVYDTIQAVLANGTSDAVVITRSAGTAPTDLSVSVAAAPTSVSAGQTSIITATVAGDDKAGAAVTFTIPVNYSGASFINTSGTSVASITVTAGGSGIATVLYQAGSVSPGTEVQDTVQAVLTNGANGAVILTRTSTVPSTYAVSIAASPSTPVTAGQVSVITATVDSVSGTTTTPAAGVSVTFTLPVNNSGATLLPPTTVTTDGNGKAVVIYQSGPNFQTLTVYDTVKAAVGTAINATVITRTGSSPSGFGIIVTAAPALLVNDDDDSIITATVTNTAGGRTVNGLVVSFAVIGRGSVVPAWAITDGSGNAVTVFTGLAPTPAGVTDVVTASVTVGGYTYTSAALIRYATP
jgi:hypothetical protein